MGIAGLTKVISDHARSAIKEMPIKNYFGRIVAIDASMSIYQFLIAIRSEGLMLTNEAGETTSHLNGFFYRTIRMVENGIKPIYVFDGKPPALKSSELKKRAQKRKEAVAGHEEAKETGEQEEVEKFSRRTVRVTPEHNEEVRKLLTLMGIPWIVAPCEAEATCAALVKAGKAYAAGTEDMDTITHGAPILLRHLTFAEARKQPILEIHLDEVLKGLNMDMAQFIDLCILLGCDYADSIKGIGPHRALTLINQHKSIEKILEHLDKEKYNIAEDWPYQEARKLFSHADVVDASTVDLKWNQPDEEGLVQFMVKEKGFNEERIRSGAKKLIRNKNTAVQGRLDGFFTKLPKPDDGNKKRKPDAPADKKTTTKKGKKT